MFSVGSVGNKLFKVVCPSGVGVRTRVFFLFDDGGTFGFSVKGDFLG